MQIEKINGTRELGDGENPGWIVSLGAGGIIWFSLTQ